MIKTFFDNRDVNLFSIHAGLRRSIFIGGSIFGPIFFYQNGFPLWLVFVLFGSIHLTRIPFRLLAKPLIERFGIKTLLGFSTVGTAFTFGLLGYVDGFNWAFYGFVASFAVFQSLFWVATHMIYAIVGKNKDRGKNSAVLFVCEDIIASFLPFVSGFIITALGYLSYYYLLSIVILLSFVPILFMGSVHVKDMNITFNQKKEVIIKAMSWTTNFGFRFMTYYAGWALALVIFAKEDLVLAGSVLTLGLIAQIFLRMLLGHGFDTGKGNKINNAAFLLYSSSFLFKAFLPLTATIVFIVEVYGALGEIFKGFVSGPPMFNISKDSHSTYWYWVGAETGFDVGVTVAGCIVGGLIYIGLPLQQLIALAVIPTAILWYLARQFFKEKD